MAKVGYLSIDMLNVIKAEANTGKGILQNHAYGIIDAKDINGNRLLRIRNP